MEQKTIVVCDLSHCGTTMLTGIIQILGVSMVEDGYVGHSREDNEIRNAAKAYRKRGDTDSLKEVIDRKNKEKDVWGFKLINLWATDIIFEHLRNPIYLLILKDPVSVTKRRLSRCDRGRLSNTLKRMIRAVKLTPIDTHFISYLDAIVAPREFVCNIAEIIGIEPTEEQIDRAIKFIQPRIGYPLVEDE